MWMKKIFSFCVAILFPEACYLCKKEGSSLCDACLVNISKPVDTPAPFIFSLYSFKDYRIKKIIHAAKYFHRKDLLIILGQKLAETKELHTLQLDLIIPIPMPKMRALVRGYNHTEVLVQCLHEKFLTPSHKNILIRQKTKYRQVEMISRKARLKNQKHAFTVTENVEGLHILLVDDVTTTGSTLFEARRELLAHGAAKVYAITVAH
jgi:ComF family protein